MLEQNAGPTQLEPESPAPPATGDPGGTTASATDDIATSRAEKIREIAYSFYEARGCVEGCALDDWLRAEARFVEVSEDADRLLGPV